MEIMGWERVVSWYGILNYRNYLVSSIGTALIKLIIEAVSNSWDEFIKPN